MVDIQPPTHRRFVYLARSKYRLAQAGLPVLLGVTKNPQVAEFSTGINA
jgi:hypothetical protein